MDFEHSSKVENLVSQVRDFIDTEVLSREAAYHQKLVESPWETPVVMEELKAKAYAKGLWNFFLPREHEKFSPGLSNLEYAPIAEQTGRSLMAPEVFNCAAPDTGNMEVLAKYGTPEQQEKWLKPLLAGKIRSAFAMTEPAVASSDATNIQASIRRDGDDYILNGHKFFISGAMRKSCEVFVFMGKSDPDNPDRHQQQSMILVPRHAESVEVVRPMQVFGYVDNPEGHAEVRFNNVRVPKENLLLGEGRGFAIAQGRLGPGRIHHCMRLVGMAQRALEMMCKRANERVVFGRPMIKQGSVREDIARSYADVEQARLLTLKAADAMDRYGNKKAKELISVIKVVAPNMALRVLDRAIQIHGAVGVSQDTPLAHMSAVARTIRLADGPDQVHMMQLGRNLARRFEKSD